MKTKVLIFAVLFLTINLITMAQDGKETLVVIETRFGDMTVMLYNDTPQHRDNFINLIHDGWYEGSPFHRVISGFMIQGGSNADGKTDPGYTVEAEIRPNHIHKKGALAAARQPDQVNPKKRSSGSQFYIVQGTVLTPEILKSYEARMGVKFNEAQQKAYTTIGGSPHLDGGYTVFGEVITGFDIIDKISAVRTDRTDNPEETVTMSIEILE